MSTWSFHSSAHWGSLFLGFAIDIASAQSTYDAAMDNMTI
jgi:hypothetical protein